MRKITFWAAMSFVLLTLFATRLEAAEVCNDQNTVKAKIAALDQAWVWNRYGALQPHGMIFALVSDLRVLGPNGSQEPDADHPLISGKVILRPDKRPRPLVLRVNRGQCLEVELTNYLDPNPRNQFQNETPPHSKCPPNPVGGGCGEQTGERMAGFHPNGLALAKSALDDGSYVGANASSLVEPGKTITYTFLAEHEGTYFAYSPASTTGGDGNGGSIFAGLFAAVHVEPKGSTWYRSQIRQDELEKATPRLARTGHPILDYSRLRILNDFNEILHSDLTAIIDTRDAEFEEGRGRDCIDQKNNVSRDPNVCADPKKPFREFTIIFHDESGAVQAFDEFDAPDACELDESSAECQKALATASILHSVRDGFAINYGTAGLGAEVLANRKKVGPVRDCPECMLEEFFLSSWAVGDPAMVVDLPANMQGQDERPKGTYFPDDPSNVYHSYLNDRLVFRNLHAGPKEHHVFHLHAHQWLQTQYNPRSAYLDSQTIGPGGTYTYEIAYGGSGNRNRGAGDSIFHCHFYPHFAQGMWSLWRVHDVFEPGTKLDSKEWEDNHLAVPVAKARALPDGEILPGSPIPALVPLPGSALAPMPGPVEIVDGQAKISSSEGDLAAYPGYPFFVPAKAGHRPPEPPKDIFDHNDGGLARHIVESGTVEADELIDGKKRSLDKKWLTLVPRFLEEDGESGERLAMKFHSQEQHKTVDSEGTEALFDTNGLPAVAGAPFSDPCPKGSKPRTFQAAVFQLDLIFNKKGWHTPQARILALKDDVMPTLNGSRAPQPLFFRVNSGDCIEYQHSNIVPRVWKQDAFQIRTPTDIIGQHIHLVKFDVTSSDGGGNGFNYEDGTASFEEVRDRIHAIRNANHCCIFSKDPVKCPKAKDHPWYGSKYAGGRVTVQRWYADPQLIQTEKAQSDGSHTLDKTLETVFTHDHFGASTHQQAGLYAGLIVEPAGSTFYDENGNEMGKRLDGGPTSWKAVIHDKDDMKLREFGILYQDFHIAYEKGSDSSKALNPPGQVAVNEPQPNFLVQWDDRCKTWPHCPEAVSADDIGAASINYRSEPAPLRLLGEDGKTQAAGKEGDLAYLFQSIPRSDADLNRNPETYPLVGGKRKPSKWPVLSPGMGKYDPFTPLIEVYDGERFKIRLLAGAHEHEHSFTLNGLSWRFMQYEPNSGERSFITSALSEHHELDGVLTLPGGGVDAPELDRFQLFDHLFKIGASVDDTWYGNWGILRAYRKEFQVSHLKPFEMSKIAMPEEKVEASRRSRDTGAKSREALVGEFKGDSMDKFQPLEAQAGLARSPGSPTMEDFDQRMEELGQELAAEQLARASRSLAESSMSELERSYARALEEERADFEETLALVGGALQKAKGSLQESPSVPSLYVAMNPEPLPPMPAEDHSTKLAGMRQSAARLSSLRDRIPKVIDLAPAGAVPASGLDSNRLAVCPPYSPLRAFAISAVAAKDVLLEGALIYHRFPSSGPQGTCPGGCRSGESWLSVSDPAALLYVRDRYLDPETPKLDPAYKVEPLILRANSGDCIEIHLTNRLPEDPAHIPGYNTLPNLVQNFNFNQLRVPSQVGIHVQGVRYHVGESDGINVGLNLEQTTAPGETRIYRFYAGRVEMRGGRLDFVPVEFGVLNLMPADPIQQNSKGLLGALVIEPPGAIWAHDQVPAEPYTARTAMLISRASATVFTLGKHFFRDLVLVGQDDVNFNLDFSRGGKARYLRPVRRVAQASHCRNAGCLEAPVQDEEVDSVDSGHKAFNYRSEALWMRRGLSAALPLRETLTLPAFDLLADSLVGVPCVAKVPNQTPRFCVEPGAPTRLRVAFPGGHGRNHVLHVHGHNFFELPFRDDSTVLGGNDWTNIKGSQDGMGPGSYYNFLFTDDAGGPNKIEASYLIRDQYSWGFDGGLWAVMDVSQSCQQ